MSDNNKTPKAAAPLAPDASISPSGFFAFRTPLLPYEELESWSAGLSAEHAPDDPEALETALAADRELLRARLRELIARPEVLEAIFLASPSLIDGLEIWRTAPDSKKGQRAERALVRYVYRMAARATPFGLFSGCSIGRLDSTPGSPTRLAVGPRAGYERHTRLDMDYLFALCEDLGKDAAIRSELLYRPNSSLYRAAGRLRYAEARVEEKVRSHHLVAVEATSYLEETLERAKGGARARDLAVALAEGDPEVTEEEAAEFVGELIDSQVLVSDLSPPVTGPESIHDVIAQLKALDSGQLAAERLTEARDLLADLDRSGPGALPERYRELAARLGDLPTSVEIARLFQLDMVKPAVEPLLGAAVVEEMARAVALLRRMIAKTGDPFERFRKDFSERYGDGREVPLIEVLDEEIGIGFERSGGAGAEASPLLRGLALPSPAAEATVPWGQKQAVLFSRLTRALTAGEQEIALTHEEVERIAPPPTALAAEPPLPDGFQVMVTLASPSAEALAQGDFLLLFNNASGPSGARLLGRFCHADPALTREVEAHLREEEALHPEALFVEIVHLPQGRIGNILARPVLRDYELAYLGRSGAPLDRQLPITDLLVSISGSRVVLRSARLGREVIPRLTSAHNFSMRSLGVYRFLCTLQTQGVIGGLAWMWGALDGAPYLPRVRYGKIVLQRASWWMTGEEIKTIKAASGPARFAAVRDWRKRRQLPRLVVLADGDNELLIDLENVLSVDTFIDVIEDRDRARLHELFPDADQLPATGPEGRFVHEILVPFVRVAPEKSAETSAEAPAPRPAAPAVARASIRRSFPPGSEWLYAKLYTGTSTADGVLHEVIAPVVAETRDVSDSWFFIRYGDPEWHLRVRFHGDPMALQTRVLPALAAASAPLLEDGRLWKMQLDTYEREIERYGGPRGIELSERLFSIDSEAVVEVLEMLDGDEGADARWRLALYGTDLLLADLGLDGAARHTVMGGMRASFTQEFAAGGDPKSIRIQLDQRLRGERKGLDTLLYASGDEHPLAPGLAVFKKRSQRLAPIVAELAARQEAGELTGTLAQIAPSYVHMHVNRMIRSAGRAHELVMYDFLHQLYQSRTARDRKRPAADEAKSA